MGIPNSMRKLCSSSLLMNHRMLMNSLIVFTFSLQYLTNAENLIGSWSVMPKPTLMIPSNFIYLWTSVIFDMKLMAVIYHYNYYSKFITFFVNWYSNRPLSPIRHFFLIPSRINEIQECRHCVSYPAWIRSAGIWTLPGSLCLFNFAIAISTSRWLESCTNGSTVCTPICLTSLILCKFSNWEE
jgi:hypothetical protein